MSRTPRRDSPPRIHSLHATRWLVGVAAVVACLAHPLAADVLRLRNGVKLEGDWLNRDKKPVDAFSFKTTDGVRFVVRSEEVEGVTEPSKLEKDYQAALAKMPETASAHWKMYQLCRTHKLRDEEEYHLQQVLRLDPDHAEAREQGGFTKNEHGEWVTRDELQRGRGFVYHSKSWVTLQEAALLDYLEQSETARRQWKGDLVRWKRQLDGRNWQEAKQNIMAIEDPAAVDALAFILGRESNPERRGWYLEVLNRLPGIAAAQVILNSALQDADPEIREQAVSYLKGERRSFAIVNATQRLRGDDPEQLNRAAYILEQLDGQSAIRPLINALTTTKHTIVSAPNTQAGFGSDGGFSFSQGGGKKKVTEVIENSGVLSALRALTDQDHRYDKQAWRNWYIESHSPRSVNLRRDP